MKAWRRRVVFIAAVLASICFAHWGWAWFETARWSGYGVRALGMGGAFASLADDSSALYWNPAGLSQLTTPEVAGSYSSVVNAWIREWWGAAGYPLGRHFALGVGVTERVFSHNMPNSHGSLFDSVDVLDATEGSYALGFAYSAYGFHIGAAIKFLLVASPDPYVDASGCGVDAGALYRLQLPASAGALSFGVAVHDIVDRLWVENPGYVSDLPAVVTVGVTYLPPFPASFALEVEHTDDPFGAASPKIATRTGLEACVVRDVLALRTGGMWCEGYRGMTLGASVKFRNIELGYAYSSINLSYASLTFEHVFDEAGKHSVGLTCRFGSL